ncbi:hypothetical protein, partial [Rhodopseudomonas sp. B29]|uniref:hypothetical protein n=1 Tax=Rhodopseudomonas sp. B29 TaxID=95607 RepID=UPI0003B5F0B0
MWATLAGAALVALLVVIAFLRARRSFANAALAVIAISSLGFAGYATLRGVPTGTARIAAVPPASNLPALSCIDDLAGDEVMAACERALFASPETIAAAVSYASARLARLTSSADAATAPELASLRRSIERDRYGLHAYALASVDRCQPGDCAAYRALGDHSRLAANMDQHLYELTVARYAPAWTGGAPLPPGLPPTAAAPSAVPLPETAAVGPVTMPTGHPNNIDYPTASSIPAVSIMTPEPGAAGSAAPKSAVSANAAVEAAPAPRPAASHNLPHAKKAAAPKPPGGDRSS